MDNPAFTPVQKALYETSKAYSSTKIEAVKAFTWLLKTLSYSFQYYVFPGADATEDGKYYFSTIAIRPDFAIHPWVSYPQVIVVIYYKLLNVYNFYTL